MNGKIALTRASGAFIFALLAACNGAGNGGGGNTSPPPPQPVPDPTPTPTPGPLTSIAIPKTGQTVCYDPNGTAAEVSCLGTGEDAEFQAGVAAPSPRFTVDSTGDCVTDNLTGLMWTRNGNLPAGSGSPDTGLKTWQEALDFSNNLELCGFSDWRLANRNELRSLINHQEPLNSVALNAAGFNNVVVGNAPYWSSTSDAGNAALAWTVNLAGGEAIQSNKTRTAYVWAVRTGQ